MDISEFESDFDAEKPSVKVVPPTKSPISIPVENTVINNSSSGISNEIVDDKIKDNQYKIKTYSNMSLAISTVKII